jgi:Ca2+-binding EF-hand superfamily protein
MNGTDPEEVIKNAFAAFDEDGDGKIPVERFREAMMTMGDRVSEEDVDDILRGAPVDSKTGMLDYIMFTQILKHGKNDD